VGAFSGTGAAAWADGAATTPMTGALAVIEISGPAAMEIFARASAVDPSVNSACAAVSFAGVTGALCRCDGNLRLHLDRGLVPYMLDWISSTRLVG
jgi:tRNA U34 5-carboxymethylaminomethyl modifying GTPase MnmE/TrmE